MLPRLFLLITFTKLFLLAVIFGQPASAQTSSTISVNATPNPASYGAPVTIQAAVTSGATGKVTFYDGPAVLGIATISGAQATFTTTLLQAGTRSLWAYYAGDATYAPSTATPMAEVVNAAPSLGFHPVVSYTASNSPVSIAVADFNNDGKQDLALTSESLGNVSVLLGNGNGTFQTAVSSTVGQGPRSVAVGDFNGDGNPDLVTVNEYGNNINILIGNGDGTFKAPVSYMAGTNPRSVVVGDFNRDGIMDLAVANYGSGGISILLGKGDGTFQGATSVPVAANPQSLAIADMNTDGKADLVVAAGSSVSILLGKGDGSFQAAQTYAAVNGGASLAIADFNADGHPDVAVGSNTTATIGVLLGKGDGTLLPVGAYSQSAYGLSILAGDFNGDGALDIAIAVYPSYSFTPNLQVMFGNGDGSFQLPVSYTHPMTAIALTGGDFNGDGIPDLAIAGVASVNGANTGAGILLGGAQPDLAISASHGAGFTQGQTGATYTLTLTNGGDTSTTGAVAVEASLSPGFVPVGASGAGWSCPSETVCTRSDALAPGGTYPPITIRFNIQNSLSSDATSTFTVSGGGDQKPSNNFAADTAFVRFISSISISASPAATIMGQTVTIGVSVTPGATGKVTFYDGITVLGSAILANSKATFITALLPQGVRSLRAEYTGDLFFGPSSSPIWTESINAAASNGVGIPATYRFSAASQYVITADLNGDGRPDLIALTSTNPGDAIAVMLGNGDGTFRSPISYINNANTYYTYPSGLVAGDFNGDGYTDVAFTDSTGLVIMLGNGDGTLRPATVIGPAPANYPYYTNLVTADFNGDGFQDLMVLYNGAPLLFAGNGDGSFQSPLAVPTNGASFSWLLLADMNGDGKPDLVCSTSSYSAAVSIFLGNGDGTFRLAGSFSGPGTYPSAVTVGDFNGDGKIDVAFIYWTAILWLPGNGDGTLGSGVTSSLTLLPGTVIAASDFNGDGKLDIAYGSYTNNQFAIAFGNPGPL